MDSKNLKTRDQIDNKYKWNIEAMIPDESIIDGALEDIEKQAGEYAKAYGGRLTSDAATLLSAFKERDSIWRELEKIYVYARMRRDEDNSDSRYQAMSSKCNAVIAAVSAALAFFTPELLSASEDDVMGFVDKEPGLEEYRFAIKDTFRQKAHILSQPEENIMAQMSEVTGATNDIFTMLNNADMKFPEITDEDGDKVAVTHGNYITFMESHDRGVRKAAYEAMYDPYKSLINTIATCYNYNTKSDVINARIRKNTNRPEPPLCLATIYLAKSTTTWWNVVKKNLPTMHRYVELRKEMLGLDKMYMYDMYVPLIQLPKNKSLTKRGWTS